MLYDVICSVNVVVVLFFREFGVYLGFIIMDIVFEMCVFVVDNKVDELWVWYLVGVDFNVGDYDWWIVLYVVSVDFDEVWMFVIFWWFEG